MFDRIQKIYAVGYMVVYLHYNSDQPEREENIAFFPDLLDAERFLSENGGTRTTNSWRRDEWTMGSYLRAIVWKKEFLVK